MVLSFCFNWETMDQLSSNLGQFYDPQSEVADALIGLYDPIDVPIDSLFDPQPPPPLDDLFANAEPALLSTLLPSFSDPSIISLPADIHAQIDEFDVCRCPKRPRSFGDLYQSSELMFEANSHNPSFVVPAMSSWPSVEFAVPPPPPPPPQPAGEKKTSGGCLSAQSIAARERRKRISEKTQELGRLIPGGNKMNTAEMFQAAFKYVKFLQAQVGILSLMGSMQGGEGSAAEVAEDLQVLLKSPTIQEKLSVEEKCIVTKEMVDAMVKDSNIRSIPFISRALTCFAELNESKSRRR